MLDDQIRKIIDKTFQEVDILVREVQEKKKMERDNLSCGKTRNNRIPHSEKEKYRV